MTSPTPTLVEGRLGWRKAFTRWQPYAVTLFLLVYGVDSPRGALFILALIHWCAIDAMRKKAKANDTFIGSQVVSIEAKHRFCGDGVSVTSRQLYRVGHRHYLVEVARTERDLEGRELA